MGFKGGKQNPYNVLKAELEAVKQELAAEREKAALQPFVDEFGKSLLVILATTTWSYWPQWAKTIFSHVERKMPTAAYMYKQRLPK